MEVEVKFFGQLAEITNEQVITVNGVNDTVQLMQQINQRYPAMLTTRYSIAVDKKIAKENTPLTDGMAIALLPPFSGG